MMSYDWPRSFEPSTPLLMVGMDSICRMLLLKEEAMTGLMGGDIMSCDEYFLFILF